MARQEIEVSIKPYTSDDGGKILEMTTKQGEWKYSQSIYDTKAAIKEREGYRLDTKLTKIICWAFTGVGGIAGEMFILSLNTTDPLKIPTVLLCLGVDVAFNRAIINDTTNKSRMSEAQIVKLQEYLSQEANVS